MPVAQELAQAEEGLVSLPVDPGRSLRVLTIDPPCFIGLGRCSRSLLRRRGVGCHVVGLQEHSHQVGLLLLKCLKFGQLPRIPAIVDGRQHLQAQHAGSDPEDRGRDEQGPSPCRAPSVSATPAWGIVGRRDR